MMVENISVFYKALDQMDNVDYFQNFISYNVALISAGVKPSITLNLISKYNRNILYLWDIYGEKYLSELKLDYTKLRTTDKSLVILIYDKELLEKYITKRKNIQFLNSIGYRKNVSLEGLLNTLSARYNIYKCPHELGIFLGYPLEDVKDFINCTNKKCLVCGYWRVYNRYNHAKAIFDLYDKVKEFTVENILKGNTKNILSAILKDNFRHNHKLIFN